MRYLLLSLALLAALTLVLRARPAAAVEPAVGNRLQLDLPRYMGRWWVIAHVPYFWEKGKIASADVYSLRPDGRIDNTFVYRKDFDGPQKRMRGVAKVVPGTGNAQWRIAFVGGLVHADYLVLEVAPDYSWALVGQPSRKLAWIFSREARMDDAQYAALARRLADHGYDPARLRRVPQFPEQQPLPPPQDS